jgi:hypothetical protein
MLLIGYQNVHLTTDSVRFCKPSSRSFFGSSLMSRSVRRQIDSKNNLLANSQKLSQQDWLPLSFDQKCKTTTDSFYISEACASTENYQLFPHRRYINSPLPIPSCFSSLLYRTSHQRYMGPHLTTARLFGSFFFIYLSSRALVRMQNPQPRLLLGCSACRRPTSRTTYATTRKPTKSLETLSDMRLRQLCHPTQSRPLRLPPPKPRQKLHQRYTLSRTTFLQIPTRNCWCHRRL